MTEYFQISTLNTVMPVLNSEIIIEKDGKYWIDDTYEMDYGTAQRLVEVYKSKSETWAVIIKDMEDFIVQANKNYEQMLSKAIKDGWHPISTEKSLNWLNKIKDNT